MQVEDQLLGNERMTGVFKITELSNGALLFAYFEDLEAEPGDPDKYWGRFVYLDLDVHYQFLGDRVSFDLKGHIFRDLSPKASVGPDDAYVLMYDPKRFWIAHISLGARRHDGAFGGATGRLFSSLQARSKAGVIGGQSQDGPTDLRILPALPGIADAHELGGRRHRLYLFAKGVIGDDQQTPWYLLGLSPETSQPISRVQLPPAASHIVAPILGGDRVAMIEKGLIALFGEKIYSSYGETSSMVVFLEGWWLERHVFEKAGGHVLFGAPAISVRGMPTC